MSRPPTRTPESAVLRIELHNLALLAPILAGAYLGPSTPGRSRGTRPRGPAVERPEVPKFDVAGKVRRLRKGVCRG